MDSAALSEDARTALDLLAEILRGHPNPRVELQSQADNTGGEARNLALSSAAPKPLAITYCVGTFRRLRSARAVSARPGLQPVATQTRGVRANRRVEAIALDPPDDLVIRREQMQ